MPIKTEIITESVRRFVTLPSQESDFGVKPKEIRDELARALQKHGRSDDHAKRVTEAIMEQCKFRPTPAEIREFCDGIQAEPSAAPECAMCGGTGALLEWFAVWTDCSRDPPKRKRARLATGEEVMHVSLERGASPYRIALELAHARGLVDAEIIEASRQCDCRKARSAA